MISKEKHKSICRFCFNFQTNREYLINIHYSRIGDTTFIGNIMNFFPITNFETHWTDIGKGNKHDIIEQEFLVVTGNEICVDIEFMTGICKDCAKIIVEFDSFLNRMRSSEAEIQEIANVLNDPKSFIKSITRENPRITNSIERNHKNCSLISDNVNHIDTGVFFNINKFNWLSYLKTSFLNLLQIFGFWKETPSNPKERVTITSHSLKLLCRFCYEPDEELLIDILSSQISNEPLRRIIEKYCSEYYHQIVILKNGLPAHETFSYREIKNFNPGRHSFRYLHKRIIQKFQICPNTPMKNICIVCLKTIIDMNILIDRIRSTNATLKLWKLLSNEIDQIEIGFSPALAFINILNQSELRTWNNSVMQIESYLHLLKKELE